MGIVQAVLGKLVERVDQDEFALSHRMRLCGGHKDSLFVMMASATSPSKDIDYFCRQVYYSYFIAMIISKYSIRFIRLREEDIELVRKWRNHESIRKYMVYREHITPGMQKKWFLSVNNNNNLYFIIEYKGKKIGLINGKDINWDKKTMETGIFIWNKYYRKTHIPTLCTLIFAELGVAIWDIKPRATILKSNTTALKYNKMLGFRVIEDDPGKEYVKLEMDRDSSGFIAKKLRAAINLLAGDEPIRLEFEQEDLESGIYEVIMNGLDPALIKKHESQKGSEIFYF